jgi:hypothetical protein
LSAPRIWRELRSRYNLIGSKCPCGELYFPCRDVCPKCRSTELTEFRFGGKGEILSYTIVRVAPKGYEKYSPYCVALIKLNEGPVIMGQIVDCEFDQLSIGKKVEVIFRKIKEQDETGTICYGYKFKLL